MGSQYAGNEDNFPADFTIPDDSDPPTASALGVPSEALGDRTANLNARVRKVDPLPALNFPKSVAVVGLSTGLWHAASAKWFGWGASDSIVRTGASDDSWTGSLVLGGNLLGAAVWDLDVAPDGSWIGTSNNGVAQWVESTSGGTVTKRGGGFAQDPEPNSHSVVFDPVTLNWIYAWNQTDVVTANRLPHISTSTNRTSWTSRVVPTGSVADTQWRLATNGTGTIVLFGLATTNAYFSRSVDGGVTWSACQVVALGFTYSYGSERAPKPQWNATIGRWVATASSLSGKHTKVFTSVDGLTWTVAATFTATLGIRSFAFLGRLWAGIANDGRVIFSTDAGVTWRRTDITRNGKGIASNGTRFLILDENQSFAYPSIGIGVGDLIPYV